MPPRASRPGRALSPLPEGSTTKIHDEDSIKVVQCADLTASRREYYFAPPACIIRPWLLRLIKDPRDAPMLYMVFNVALVTLPCAALAFASRSHLAGALYWLANTLLFHERFILGMHYYAHRGLFKSRALNAAVPALLTPLFGLPAGLYHLHHVVMHHVENNADGWDLSSTEMYQRDRLSHLACYWLRFLALIWFELPLYAWRRGRRAMAACCALSVLAFFAGSAWLYRCNPQGTTWVVLFPTLANSLMLMLGNWCQHIFVDPSKPRCSYHLAYNVIDHPCNQRTFNDGYHVEHHVNSRRHWSELPGSFVRNLARYRDEDAIVFRGIDNLQASLLCAFFLYYKITLLHIFFSDCAFLLLYIQVGYLVFRERYSVLASHLVQLRDPPRSCEQVERYLRARLVPVVSPPLQT